MAMNVAYINPFLASTRSVFETMVRAKLSLGAPALKRAEDRLFKLYTVSAMIDLSGAVVGRVVVSFSPTVAYAVGGALAGRSFDRVDEDLMDALGEIANMIAGGAKTSMPQGGNVQISTPRVIPAHAVTYPPGVPVIVLPFDTTAGRFVIETAIRPADGAAPTQFSQAPLAAA